LLTMRVSFNPLLLLTSLTEMPRRRRKRRERRRASWFARQLHWVLLAVAGHTHRDWASNTVERGDAPAAASRSM